jgi:hypothetical protein
MMKYTIVVGILLLAAIGVKAQTCECEKEFLYIKKIVENNFSGFADRIKTLSKAGYEKKVNQLLKLTHNRFSSDNCPLIIAQYIDIFKSHHLGFSQNFDYATLDTAFISHRPVLPINDAEIAGLKKSKSWEGIYYFIHDSSTRIAVIKDPSPVHDYIAVVLESTRPTWKKGMIKFEGKLVNDSLLTGLLYMRNHRPKFESFLLHENKSKIGGDWRREGAPVKANVQSVPVLAPEQWPTIHAKSITPNTLYIKMASFALNYKPEIDSILKANEPLLNSTPNLILDLRDNGGGGDVSWEPLIPYFYTQPIKSIGADMRATEMSISLFKKYLTTQYFSEEDVNNIKNKIAGIENAKEKWIRFSEDRVDSSFQPKPFPKKIVILIDRWCGSATEELLLAARQSSKVILVGENTVGNLDYSNLVQIPFSCYPYTLVYPTTRSRRLDIHEGIDNIGIAPKYYLTEKDDWIKEALKIAEQQQ